MAESLVGDNHRFRVCTIRYRSSCSLLFWHFLNLLPVEQLSGSADGIGGSLSDIGLSFDRLVDWIATIAGSGVGMDCRTHEPGVGSDKHFSQK
jgi:hypothetical protein